MLSNGEQKAEARSQEKGFTLIELVMTIVILGFLSTILVPFFKSITHSPDPMLRQQAVSLGQALMDEILAKRWDNNTPTGGGPVCTDDESGTGRGNGSYTLDCTTETIRIAGSIVDIGPDIADGEATTVSNDRRTWDDVDDYDGLNETSGTLRDQNNNSLSISRYTREVDVGYIQSNTSSIDHDTAFYTSGSTDSKLIKVTVTSPLDEKFYLVAVVCNF